MSSQNALFNKIQTFKPSKNWFPLGHEVKTTTNFGRLTPVLCMDVVPGDTFKLSTELFARCLPLIAPVMHRVNVFVHYFYVPNRIVWNNWKEFLTGSQPSTSGQVTRPAMITLDTNQVFLKNFGGKSTLWDYLGFPILKGKDKSRTVESIPFRAYQKIYNDWYRDENLIDEIPYDEDAIGAESTANNNYENLLTIRTRAWEKDYFTSALPWTQKGEPMELVLNGVAPVVNNPDASTNGRSQYFNKRTGGSSWLLAQGMQTSELGQVQVKATSTAPANDGWFTAPGSYEPDPSKKGWLADMSNITIATIEQLREAWSVQRFKELNAVAGSRYVEMILAHFGIRVPDMTIQRPHYLGGVKAPLTISEVLQQSQSQPDSPLGDMAGHGISAARSHEWTYAFLEHGYVMGILSILPRTGYSQGIPRRFLKKDYDEFYWPLFAHLGEQAVGSDELFFDGTAASGDNEDFGYQSRYAEYKYEPSKIHGEFHDTLDFWNLNRQFANKPVLNQNFIECKDTNLGRIFNVEDPAVGGDPFILQLYHNLYALRPMPFFGTPH